MTLRKQIILKAIEILKNNPEGVRYTELVRKIKTELPNISIKTIYGTIYNLDDRMPEQVEKPVRGLFRFIPKFEILVRAARHEPDRFFVNKYIKLIEDELF